MQKITNNPLSSTYPLPEKKIENFQLPIAQNIKYQEGTIIDQNLNPENLMRHRINEIYPGFSATYLRWATSANSISPNNKLYGIAEYLKINNE